MKKTLYFATNYNGKLACQNFIHIDQAPRERIPESRLSSTIFELHTKDNSHPPVQARLMDLARIQLNQLTQLCTWQSHGMEASAFKSWFMDQTQGANRNTEMAIYFYCRCD